MTRAAALCASLLCACSFPGPPTLLPPPFGPDPDRPEPARFFFPTGIAIDASWVVVTNSNADRLYDAGAMYSLRAADLAQYFPPNPPRSTDSFPDSALAGKVIIGNYSGPLVLAGGTAYTGSRDTNRLNAVTLDPATGSLACRGSAGDDCRGASIDLKNALDDLKNPAEIEGPFGIAAGKFRPPGFPGDIDAVLVNSLVPHIDEIQSGIVLSSSRLVALDQADPTHILFTSTVTDRSNGSGFGGGPIVFDDAAREVIVAGCYTRFGAASAGGEASTLKCGTLAGGSNLLRFVPVEAGSSAKTRIYDLGSQVHSSDTTGLALGDVDPASGLRRLYMTTRFADTLVRIGLPADPAFVPVVEAIVPISSQPSQILRLQRPGSTSGPDLLAITAVATYEASTTAGKLVLMDGMLGRVVGQVDRLGDTPFAIAQFPPKVTDTSARLAITLFGGCSVALVDVPYDRPGDASLRAKLGSCPP
ncbi:MAG TPA: hypothetical protein VF994_08915 [Myxococcales bacterium]